MLINENEPQTFEAPTMAAPWHNAKNIFNRIPGRDGDDVEEENEDINDEEELDELDVDEDEDDEDVTGNADLEDDTPLLDEQDLEENDITDDEADDIEWDDSKKQQLK